MEKFLDSYSPNIRNSFCLKSKSSSVKSRKAILFFTKEVSSKYHIQGQINHLQNNYVLHKLVGRNYKCFAFLCNCQSLWHFTWNIYSLYIDSVGWVRDVLSIDFPTNEHNAGKNVKTYGISFFSYFKYFLPFLTLSLFSFVLFFCSLSDK